MKNTFKKMAALLMAVAMVITSMSITAFAAKDADVTVKGVDSGKVTLYQVVKEGNGAWVQDPENSFADIENPKEAEVTALAKKASSLTAVDEVKTADGSDLVWEGLDPGVYLVLVTETTDASVYNPMLVSVDYDVNNSNSVDAETATLGETAVAKKTTPDVDKKIKDYHEWSNANGDTTNAGDTVHYEVETTIPSYSTQFKEPKFFFSDALGAGLAEYAGNLVVKEGSKTLVAGTDYTFEDAYDGKSFKINIKVKTGEAARDLVISYDAKIEEEAFKSGFDPNTNTAKIEYSHDPANESKYKEDKDETHHYTFNIDGELNGLEGEKDKWTDEIIKVGEDGKEFPGAVASKTEYESDVKYKNAELKNAIFGLYDLEGNEIRRATTGAGPSDGRMEFKGLDAGKYVIKEIKAPDGYQKVDTEIPVEIIATIDGDGILTAYEIKINGNSSKYTYNAETKVVTRTGESKTTFVKNQKAGSLPSTGGMGTVIFTIAGIAIMAIAAGLFIANKKSSK